jgi:hypothetical protein
MMLFFRRDEQRGWTRRPLALFRQIGKEPHACVLLTTGGRIDSERKAYLDYGGLTEFNPDG